MTKSRFVGIDLFAGSGGLTYGLRKAGFNMKLGIDIDPYSLATLKKNNGDIEVVESDVQKLNPLSVIKKFEIDKDEVSLIAGGPPCRGFSNSNRKTRTSRNPINNLYLEFFKFIKELHPKIFLFENVEGIKTLNQGTIFNDILKLGKKLGYFLQWSVINAINYGVPQRRKRIFLIGSQFKNINFFKFDKRKITTVRDAIDDLPILNKGNKINELEYSRNVDLSEYQKKMRSEHDYKVSNNLLTKNSSLVIERYKHIPQGGNWKNIPSSLMYNYKNLHNCHTGIYHRLKWKAPSIPISNFRKCMLIHPCQNRGLSVREAARLQSFPDHYIFYGLLGSQQQQVANAVPPLVGEKIGMNIIKHLEGN